MAISSYFEQPLFYQYLFLFTSCMLTLLSQTALLYRCLRASIQERLSANILLNMALWCFSSMAGIIYIGYMMFSSSTSRNGPFIFASGSAFVTLTTAVSLSVTFLLLDRIFILTMPMQYRQNRHMFIFVTVASCTLLVVYIVSALIITELPVEESTICNSFGCVLKRNNGVVFSSVKIVVGFLNVIVAIIFQAILYNFTSTVASKQHFKRANVLTTIAALSEFLCNFLPNLLWSIAAHLQWEHLAVSGPYAALMIGVDALCTAFIYRFIITSRKGIRLGSRHFAWTHHSNSRRSSVMPHPLQVSSTINPTTTNHSDHHTLQMPVWSMDVNRVPGSLQVPS